MQPWANIGGRMAQPCLSGKGRMKRRERLGSSQLRNRYVSVESLGSEHQHQVGHAQQHTHMYVWLASSTRRRTVFLFRRS
jgi:hypothetical protein